MDKCFKSPKSLRQVVAIFLFMVSASVQAQVGCDTLTNFEKDSLYISAVQDQPRADKVLHAEPLYIDLIRDLGARKGEHEWNLGIGLTDNLYFDSYTALVEYEWAPVNRLGLEIELPFTFYAPMGENPRDSIPANKLEGLKLAAQWSFYVSEKHSTSLALGYINQFEMSDFNTFGNPLIKGNIYNPFLVAAKRWGQNFHTLLYTGMKFEQNFQRENIHAIWEGHFSFHYMIPGTRNFLGVELNQYVLDGHYAATLRPQMRLGIADNFLIGIVGGIPIQRKDERFSSFVRLIWEPRSKTLKNGNGNNHH